MSPVAYQFLIIGISLVVQIIATMIGVYLGMKWFNNKNKKKEK